jgi:uncharacterized protein (TIGR02246 family)
MRLRLLALTGVLGAACTIGGLAAWEAPGANRSPPPADQDRDAIEKSARDFAAAFEKRDAKAIAAMWTENGELDDDSGEVLRGRAAIESAYADLFKAQPQSKMDVRIESIRFPSRDCAIEEGVLRQVRDSKDLPSSTQYSVFHVRDNGQWRIAASREWGAGQDRLDDLEWLLGTWKGTVDKEPITLTLERDDKQSCIIGKTTRKKNDKEVSAGSMRIALDPQRGQIRSWHFDPDGGHGQSLWIRDGNNWVLDAIGVGGDGMETEAVNILARVGANEITWRSIDRVAGNVSLPDSVPIKLTRATSGK